MARHSPGPELGATIALASSATIVATADVARVTPAAAVTGVILAAGSFGGQHLEVINTGLAGSTITFAAAGTSRVADGVTTVIPGLRASLFTWDDVSLLWYRMA